METTGEEINQQWQQHERSEDEQIVHTKKWTDLRAMSERLNVR